MSIKKLFGSTDKPNNYLSDSTEKEAFQEVESARNVTAIAEKQQTYVPQIDYRNPANFAKYGSAYLYYKSSIERVIDFFPYDGSDAEINEYHNKSLDIDKYIFNNLYPRSTGYITISPTWGTLSGSKQSGYGLPSILEHIDFKGGPNTVTTDTTAKLFDNPNSSNRDTANTYDADIYTTARLPSDYGSGSRESNLKSDFDRGVTVEFWAKTGSLLSTSLTEKQVFADFWNNEISASSYNGVFGTNPNPAYGRLTIAYNQSHGRFNITAQSGSTGIFEQQIGLSVGTTLSDWKHYAFSFYNSGSSFNTKLHINGVLNDSNSVPATTISEINSKSMVGRIGALLTAPSGTAGSAQEAQNLNGAGKLSGSLDEFRFWKVRRNTHEIAKYYFTQVRGGTNTDISNTTLGLYYKFNEGLTGTSAIDSVVLDYSGRISNGTWTGYSAACRNTGSAILSSSAASVEYEDPIIRPTHPDVVSLKAGLLDSGSFHDASNVSSMISMIPTWIVEDQESVADGNIQVMSHIVGAYFDKLHLLISALPKFRSQTYTSASYTPLAFAQHLPQSLGLYSPELFLDSDVLERFMNRNQTMLFENDLTETKNLIYLNLYNNLANIFKSKGTEKSIRNVFRCFNVDERLVKLNVYADNATYNLKDNLKQELATPNQINFNNRDHLSSVVFQAADPTNAESLGYISGSHNAGGGYEDKYGLTFEANVTFPSFSHVSGNMDRDYSDVSLFGLYSVDTGSADNLSGVDVGWVAEDFANFQVMAVKDSFDSRNVYFKLTSSNFPYPLPELTSSTFFNTYDDNRWNLSLRLKPSNWPVTEIVTGSEGYTYDVIFRGINTVIGDIQDSFLLTGSVSKEVGQNILHSTKRLYAGARRTNITGAVLQQTDVLFSNVKYWAKYVDDVSIDKHLYDINNQGISGSYQSISPRDSNNSGLNILNSNALVLSWDFENVTASDGSGNFYVTDMSSGSVEIRNNYGWLGNMAGYQLSGKGYGFKASSTDVISKKAINTFKFIDPEQVIGSNMVQILSEDDKVFGIDDSIPSYRYVLEKSMYGAISEEMLSFFAGVVDFNNVIGEPVNRYRSEYKSLSKLREIFFRRVTEIKQVEKYIDYYKWFDDSLAAIIGQLLPASADFDSNTLNTIESHVLERNKYKTQFPTIEFKGDLPEAAFQGLNEINYKFSGLSPVPQSPRPTTTDAIYWKDRAERSAAEITSGDSTVDAQRNTIRDVVSSVPTLSQSIPILSTHAGSTYTAGKFKFKQLPKTYDLSIQSPFSPKTSFIKGGINFEQRKSFDFTHAALHPAGPINREDNKLIPENVLYADVDDLVGLKETHIDDINKSNMPNQKTKRFFKVQHGRDWESGEGYSNTKSSFSFPFNVISSSVISGFNKQVVNRVTGGIEITNLHSDAYGSDLEVPMQGPFTNYAVGGHQSRHIKLNKGTDDYTNRPEAWKILLGKCVSVDGALGMVGADYPWPEANEGGDPPYPMTASQKAVFYRDHVAKRPVNIRNIHHTTGSTILGNYNHQYDIVQSPGAYSNPRRFVQQRPTLPTPVMNHGESVVSSSTNVVNNFMNLHRTDDSHYDFDLTYAPVGITGSDNRSVIVSRFSAPGGTEAMSRGFLDIRGGEYSPYNCISYRNMTVLKPSQGPSDTISEITGIGVPGIRVYDIHTKDYGLRSHLARHTARFGRDSLIYPMDENRETYNLNKPFVGYGGVDAYRTTGSLQGWWRLNEDVSSAPDLPADSSPKGRTGGFDASDDRPDFSSSAFPSRYVQTSSCGFSGGVDGVNIGVAGTWNVIIGNAAASTKKMTFSAWIYKVGDGGGNYGRILEFGDGDVRFYTNNVESIYFDVTAWSGANAQWHATSPFSLTTWTHVAVTYDATSTNNNPIIYVNGIAKTVTEDTAPAGTYGAIATNACYIGNRSDATRGFNGQLSDVAVWNSILSPEEIKAIYNASKLPETVGPGASYSQFPGFHKTHRNATRVLRLTGVVDFSYDNFHVQHAIPRSDRQYAWITASLAPGSNDLRYYGLMPIGTSDVAGKYSGSTGYVSYFNFVSSSMVGKGTDVSRWKNIFQPTNRLNIYALEPASWNNTDNLIGVPEATLDRSIVGYSYLNNTLLNHYNPLAVSASINDQRASYFNLIMTQRGGPAASAFKRFQQGDNRILVQERKDNQITMVTGSDNNLTKYRLTPVSMKGKPVLINFQLSTNEDVTFKVTDNNNRIFFEETAMNNLAAPSLDAITTPYDQVLKTIQSNYSINWISYAESLYPSTYNEFFSSSIQRTAFDNKYWRDNQQERVTLGNELPNSFGQTCKQSLWCLDAPKDFLTRTEPTTWRTTTTDLILSGNAAAGELQNIYYHLHPTSSIMPYGGSSPTKIQEFNMLRMAALYSRKHTIWTPRSVAAPTGPRIAETGSGFSVGTNGWDSTKRIELFAGEAQWEAASQAGIVSIEKTQLGGRTVNSAITSSYPSAPWFNEYTDFSHDLKLVAKNYSIIPEFRISEHIEDYVKFGLFQKTKTDTFAIPGTALSSSTESFYKDYSNSDFMNNFLNIKEDSLLNAAEIRLVCSAAIRFNPYKGFYPAQRTIDLVSQFSRSYSSGFYAYSTDYVNPESLTPKILVKSAGGGMRPLMQTLYSPGILYNSIKSGMAVDYPIITDHYKIKKHMYTYSTPLGSEQDPGEALWAIGASSSFGSSSYGCPISGAYFDKRIDFEAIIDPTKHISDVAIIDMESHPSATLNVTSSLIGGTYDDIYSRMAGNFFGEVGNFFLKDKEYTKLKSGVVSSGLTFRAGEVFGARIKLKRSTQGVRSYTSESGSVFNNTGYAPNGAAVLEDIGGVEMNFLTTSYYPIPQDPRQLLDFKETFTMYSRPSAFGPPIAGRPFGSGAFKSTVENTSPLDSFNGFNGAYTPPYTNGEAWADIIFRPKPLESYDLEQILATAEVIYWRTDPGDSYAPSAGSRCRTSLISSHNQVTYDTLMSSGSTDANHDEFRSFYGGKNINHNVMQLSASFNLFGVESVFESEVDKFGTEIKTVNKGIGKRWVIQPKFETPMMNFNDTGLRKVTADAGTLTIPTFGSASVPRGMWHQFGMIESDPDKGIFIEIDDIPENWLKNHYDVVKYNSAYNNDDAEANGALVYKKMKSLSDLVGFTKNTRSARLGELSETQTLLEAVVAIPYIIDVSGVTDVTSISSTQRSSMKKFFEIPEERLTAAQSESDGSEIGDSMDAAGASIRKLIQKMERYILPPQFDFLNNDSVTPIVMYMFEFEYKLDKDDLSYIWQNLAPRNYKDMSMEVQSVAHELIDAELLNESNLMDNENLRWMVFKVKQRSQIDYYDNIIEQINRTNDTAAKLAVSKTISNKSQTGKFGKRSVDGTDDYLLNFNWPYDYVSFVEMVKMDAEVLYKGESDDSGKSAQERNAASAREQVMSDLQSGPSAALSSNKTSSRSKGVRTASSSGRKSLKSTSSRSSSTPSRKSKSATKNRGGLK